MTKSWRVMWEKLWSFLGTVARGVVFYAVRMVYVVTLFVVVSSLWWFLNGLIDMLGG